MDEPVGTDAWQGEPGPGRWLDGLRTFDTVVRARGFTAAARRLGVSQGAVSQQVRCLERRLGVRLLHRSSRRLELTAAGERLLPHAERLLADHAALLAAMADVRGAGPACLRVAASAVPGEWALPCLVTRFGAARPDVRVRLLISDTARAAEAVAAGEAALGVLGGEAGGDRLQRLPVGEDEVVAVAPGAANDRSGLERRACADGDGWPQRVRWLLREPGSGTRRCVDAALTARGLAPETLPVAAELGSPQALRAAVLAGEGCAFLSRGCVDADVRAGRMRLLPLPGGPVRRTVFAAWARERPPEGAAAAFVELLRAGMPAALAPAAAPTDPA